MAAEVGRRAEDLRCNIVQLLRVKTAREVISLGKYCLSQKESLIISIAPTLLQMKIAKTSDEKRKNIKRTTSRPPSQPSPHCRLGYGRGRFLALPYWNWRSRFLWRCHFRQRYRYRRQAILGGAGRESLRGWLTTQRHLLEWKGAVAEHGWERMVSRGADYCGAASHVEENTQNPHNSQSKWASVGASECGP